VYLSQVAYKTAPRPSAARGCGGGGAGDGPRRPSFKEKFGPRPGPAARGRAWPGPKIRAGSQRVEARVVAGRRATLVGGRHGGAPAAARPR
jgi:hypothetical protein